MFAAVCPGRIAKADQRLSSYPYRPTPEQKAQDEEVSRWVQKAEKLLDQNDLRGARRAAEEALRIVGDQQPVSYGQSSLADELAPVYLRAEQYGRAVALFGPHPDLGRNLSLNEAIALVKTGRLADARKCWRESQMLTYHKDLMPYLPALSSARGFEATVFLCRGIADVDQNHPASAIWALHHARQIVPSNPLALWYSGEAFAHAGQPKEARRFFLAASAHDPGLIGRKAHAGLLRLNYSQDH